MGEFKGKQHKLTKEEKSKGGKASTIAKKLAHRKKCDETCPLFDRCPLASFGMRYNTCYLNKDNPTLRKNVLKLLNGDEEDFFDIMNNIVSDMLRIIITEDDGNIRTKKLVVDALRDFYNMKFGTKSKIEHSGKIDIELFKKYLQTNDKNEKKEEKK